MKEKKARKTDPPLHLEMGFDEALARFAQTKPEEVEPPPGRKRKKAKPKRSFEQPVQHDKGTAN